MSPPLPPSPPFGPPRGMNFSRRNDTALLAPVVGPTLGGYITLLGLVFVISDSQSVTYENADVGTTLDDPIASIFSVRILISIAIFVNASDHAYDAVVE